MHLGRLNFAGYIWLKRNAVLVNFFSPEFFRIFGAARKYRNLIARVLPRFSLTNKACERGAQRTRRVSDRSEKDEEKRRRIERIEEGEGNDTIAWWWSSPDLRVRKGPGVHPSSRLFQRAGPYRRDRISRYLSLIHEEKLCCLTECLAVFLWPVSFFRFCDPDRSVVGKHNSAQRIS